MHPTLSTIPSKDLDLELLQRACTRSAALIIKLEMHLAIARAKHDRRIRELARQLGGPSQSKS